MEYSESAFPFLRLSFLIETSFWSIICLLNTRLYRTRILPIFPLSESSSRPRFLFLHSLRHVLLSLLNKIVNKTNRRLSFRERLKCGDYRNPHSPSSTTSIIQMFLSAHVDSLLEYYKDIFDRVLRRCIHYAALFSNPSYILVLNKNVYCVLGLGPFFFWISI